MQESGSAEDIGSVEVVTADVATARDQLEAAMQRLQDTTREIHDYSLLIRGGLLGDIAETVSGDQSKRNGIINGMTDSLYEVQQMLSDTAENLSRLKRELNL